MGGRKRISEYFKQRQLRLLKQSGILDSITVSFPGDLPPVGYVRAMKGLVDMNISEIILGCTEVVSKRDEYFAQACILLGFVDAVVLLFRPEIDAKVDLNRLSDLIFDTELPKPIELSTQLCYAQIHNQMGNFFVANRVLDKLATEYPNNGLIFVVKSGILTNDRDISMPDRCDSLRRCCALLPNFYEVHAEKALLEFPYNPIEQNKFTASLKKNHLKALKDLSSRFPRELEPRLKLAYIYLQEQSGKAVNVLNALERDFPDELDGMSCLRGLMNIGQPIAVEYFNKAIKVDPDDYMAYHGLCAYYGTHTRQLDKAMEVATLGLGQCMDEDFNVRMFQLRQRHITIIDSQDFWDHIFFEQI